MNGRNENFRKSLTRADSSSMYMTIPLYTHTHTHIHTHTFIMFVCVCGSVCVCVCVGEDVERVEVLEGQWRAALNKHRHKKKQVRQLEEDMQVRNTVR